MERKGKNERGERIGDDEGKEGDPCGGCRHVSGPCCPHCSQGPYSSIRILTDCQSLITTHSRGPARQPDSVCISIWSHFSSISKTSSTHIQWIPSHICIPGNPLADLEAKRGSTLPQTSVPVDLATAKVLIWRTGHRRSFRPATNATRTQPLIAPSLETPTRRHAGDLDGPEASASLSPS